MGDNHLTNSKISCFSSSCRSSCLDRLRATGAVVVSSWWSEARNVGVPSTVITMGLRPPRSNSCADILRTGVVVPLLPLAPPPPLPQQPDEPTVDWRSLPVGVTAALPPLLPTPPPLPPQLLAEAWETSHASTTFLVAFLKTQNKTILKTGKWYTDFEIRWYFDSETFSLTGIIRLIFLTTKQNILKTLIGSKKI